MAGVFQRKMYKWMEEIEGVLIYIDDFLVISKWSYEEHLEVVKRVKWMKEINLQVNIDKSHFAVQEVEYLGYVLTWEGVKP